MSKARARYLSKVLDLHGLTRKQREHILSDLHSSEHTLIIIAGQLRAQNRIELKVPLGTPKHILDQLVKEKLEVFDEL